MTIDSSVDHPDIQGRPQWAGAMGRDQYGPWAALEVDAVRQRMRWIPPGTFVMESPDTERSWVDKVPLQHEVTLPHGYWLGETPVTQALWVAVMGEHPSGFRGDLPGALQRPVEFVSWNDCQVFLGRLNARVAGLFARLPTEAEWVRACRPAMTTATLELLKAKEASDAKLDAFDRSHGIKPEVLQNLFSFSPALTGAYPVGRRAPNQYGLHDMIGNVWEWCQDADLPAFGPAVDVASHSRGSDRVVRGGPWTRNARHVRAPHRDYLPPDNRSPVLGFRIAGGQDQLVPMQASGSLSRRR